MWTDEMLKEKQEFWGRWANRNELGIENGDAQHAELCRLARLGLAAEQVGRWNFQEAVYLTDGDVRVLEPFLNHEAWKK